MEQFFAMGGYGGFVWSSFGIALIVMAFLWFVSMRGWRKSEEALLVLRQHRRQRRDIENDA
ncbi:MAG: heme exporter protein CcmD [Alphaproteobacteria bacterium]|nr:heme exporter protein CcmD [Alphaproteobacteria bacterium]